LGTEFCFWWDWGLNLGPCTFEAIYTFSPFCFSYYSDRVSHFLHGTDLGPWSLCLCLLYSWDYRCIPPCLACSQDRVLLTFFFPGCSQIAIFLSLPPK
jgi:hypothetical protein